MRHADLLQHDKEIRRLYAQGVTQAGIIAHLKREYGLEVPRYSMSRYLRSSRRKPVRRYAEWILDIEVPPEHRKGIIWSYLSSYNRRQNNLPQQHMTLAHYRSLAAWVWDLQNTGRVVVCDPETGLRYDNFQPGDKEIYRPNDSAVTYTEELKTA